jgi:hypothetical protein
MCAKTLREAQGEFEARMRALARVKGNNDAFVAH